MNMPQLMGRVVRQHVRFVNRGKEIMVGASIVEYLQWATNQTIPPLCLELVLRDGVDPSGIVARLGGRILYK